ncbi:MAG TPA: M48 family metallopeptidase [Thermoanaerobaculia bacterium]|jgi:Zn-dependent protease with chaperone function|nr:M48 family metallopeptidase [Thermoanaerobaculia bacterium]
MRNVMLLGAMVFALTISAQPKGELGVGSGEWKQPTATASAPTPHTQPPTPHRHEKIHVTPEMIRHSRIYDVLYFVGFAYGIGVLVLILRSGWSARMRDFASRRVRWPFVAAMLYFVLLSLVTAILTFPLDLYGGFIVPHQFDLTNQSFAAWMGDFGKALAVNIVIFSPIAAVALILIRRIRHWWLALWIGSIPLILLGVLAQPLIIDPLFNKFEPLRDASLRQALIDEASRAGIENKRVYEVDKSKQTKEMNAYVSGIGPSARIVMWDTLLAKLDRDEILAVMGHEMGHYVLKHLWKGIAFTIAITFLGFLIAQRLFEAGLARWGVRWRVSDRADAAAIPWLLAVSSILAFLLSPVYSGYSRHVEHQADVFGLELTHLNDAMASSFVKFAEDSKADPRPPRFIEWWRYSHPSLGRRIDFVLAYKPWEKGQPNELWRTSADRKLSADVAEVRR